MSYPSARRSTVMTMAEPDNAVDLGPAARRLADLGANGKAAARARPPPCPAYSLGALLGPVGGLTLAFTAAGRKGRNDSPELRGAGDAARLAAVWRDRI